MKRRTFLAMLGGTALSPLFPSLPGRAALIEVARTENKLWNSTAEIFMDFENARYMRKGVPCRMEDVLTMSGNARIDYDSSGRCLGLWVGEGGQASINTKLKWSEPCR